MRDNDGLQALDATYAIRMGDWKFAELADIPPFEHQNGKKAELAPEKAERAPKHDEMLNLKADLADQTNVLAANADRAGRMRKLLTTARDHGLTRPDKGNVAAK